MSKIVTSLLMAAVMACSVVFAQDNLHIKQNGQERVEFAVHGKTGCVKVADRIFCAPAINRAPVRMAATLPN